MVNFYNKGLLYQRYKNITNTKQKKKGHYFVPYFLIIIIQRYGRRFERLQVRRGHPLDLGTSVCPHRLV